MPVPTTDEVAVHRHRGLALRDGHERGTSSTRFGFDCLAAPSRGDTMHGGHHRNDLCQRDSLPVAPLGNSPPAHVTRDLGKLIASPRSSPDQWPPAARLTAPRPLARRLGHLSTFANVAGASRRTKGR
jgi:hypothetical protein